ncbi:MAG: YceI family protein, partial [Chloroflexi bacterium]|nr:YceI family protein [Chloroflexota bacterium]
MKKIGFTLCTIAIGLGLTACFALTEPEEASGPVTAATIEAESNEGLNASANATIFEIDQEQSEARFTIKEVLRGEDTTVVGVANAMAGQIALDLEDPSSAQVGEIAINARSLITDNNFRNRAIANEILLTGMFEFITFVPTDILDLPETVAVGESYEFQIVGDLTVTNQTREVTFDTIVTAVSETKLSGIASTEILYAEFGIVIPFAMAVNAVEDN